MAVATDQPQFEPMETPSRLPRLRDALESAKCDALLVTNRSNVRYLSGFTGSAGMLFVSPDEAILTTDGRYRSQAESELASTGVEASVEIGGLNEQDQAIARAVRAGQRVGLEASDVTWARQRALGKMLTEVELVPTTGVVEALRVRKDGGELARIEAAAAIADAALARCIEGLTAGTTEVTLAASLDAEMRRLGASGSAFETIVAGGPNSAMPHARPSPRPIGRGELVVIDFGAVVDGYRSDMTRTICLGQPATTEVQRVVEVVGASQAEGVASVREGTPARDVDRACRAVIADAGWAKAFAHGTGHGVGLDIHESPSVAPRSADMLEAGSVVTVEPGVYLPGVGGARIEDTVVVTRDGCRVLTKAPKELIV
jgi:Xaa-Pro aminopeptidase